MKINYVETEGIPILSWCALIKEHNEVTVYHGEGVYISDLGFIEGAWDGDFSTFNFEQADFLLGSGGKLNANGQMIFATPSHTLERLYSILIGEELYLSNSLPVILTFSKTALMADYIYYERDFCSIVHGLKDYVKNIPLQNEQTLTIHYYCNLQIKNGHLIELPKAEIKPFKHFAQYKTRLFNTVNKIVQNSQAPERESAYGLVTTISQGYDASACATIAKQFGCDVALTFNEPDRYLEDSGAPIAEALGYSTIITKNADYFKKNSDLLEAEFLASGELGNNAIFIAFEEEFKGNIVVTGIGGDFFWDINEISNNQFVFFDENYPQFSMMEYRLRVGFIMLPIPYYGAAQWESIHQINFADNMKHYRLGGNYDRPIPRRLLEEAGVDRALFANKNIGAGFNYRYDNLSRLKSRMSSTSFTDFHCYYQQNRRKSLMNSLYWIRFLWSSKIIYTNFLLQKLHISKQITRDYPLVPNPGPPSYLIQWAVNTMMAKIQAAMQSN